LGEALPSSTEAAAMPGRNGVLSVGCRHKIKVESFLGYLRMEGGVGCRQTVPSTL
jgi:hypothetical protein